MFLIYFRIFHFTLIYNCFKENKRIFFKQRKKERKKKKKKNL